MERKNEIELRVLLVDDDEDEYILLQDLVDKLSLKPGQCKIELDWAYNFETAIETLTHNHYDACLVDYNLGEYSGLDVLREINSQGYKTTVILLTGQGNYEIDLAAMQEGAADYLSKDQLDAPLLERTIRYAVEHKKIQEELEIRVRDRTAALEQANQELKAEIKRRTEVELELRGIKAELEDRVKERTEELQQANQYLDAIFNHIAEAVTVYDEKGKLLKANQVAIQNLGLDPKSLSKKEPQQALSFLMPDGSPVNEGQFPIQRAMRGETVRQEPYIYRAPFGQDFTILLSATPMYSDGDLTGVVAIAHDVTEREQLVTQLAVEQNRLQAIIQNAASGIIVADNTGSIILTNPIAELILGRSLPKGSNLAAQEGLELCYPDGSPYLPDDIILTRAAKEGKAFTNVEMLVKASGQDARYILANATPIYDTRGRRNGAVGVFQDITSRKQHEETLHRRASRAQLLAVLSKAFVEAGLDDRTVLDTITEKIAEHVGDACILRLISQDGEWLEPVSFSVNQPEIYERMKQIFATFRQHVSEGPSGIVLRTGKPLLIPNIQAEQARHHEPRSYWDWLDRYSVYSLLVVPLHAKDHPLGTLLLLRIKSQSANQPTTPYTLEDLQFFEDLSGRAALAIENARLYEEVQRLSVTDPLTGLFNRRGLLTLGENELRRAHRFRHPTTMIMVDIDHFKKVNDTYGHAVGDDVLRVVGERLRHSLRTQDILARYGGEEFAILVPECNAQMAELVAERLRLLFENHPVETQSGDIAITVSLGAAVNRMMQEDLLVLLDRADSALYAAKQAGRNCVKVAEEK